MTTGPAIDISAIQRHATNRARELGGAPCTADVDISWAGLDAPAGVRLFRAEWIDRSGWRALTGAVIDGRIESRPLDLIGTVLQRWRATEGALPNAATAAAACAFLLDAEDRHRALLDGPADMPESVPASLWPQVQKPAYFGGERELPLVFWWLDAQERLMRVEIGRRDDGRIAFDAKAIVPRGECQ